MSKSKENKEDSMDIKLNLGDELRLFKAITKNRPVGIDKHFKMALIVENLASAMDKPVMSDTIWKYLATLFNLNILDEMEPTVEYVEEEFALPNDFAALQQLKEQSAPVEKKAKSKLTKETPKRETVTKEAVIVVKKEVIKTPKDSPKTQKAIVKTPHSQPAAVETPKGAKGKVGSTPKTRDSAKKTDVAKEKREPRELKNLGTPEVKPQQSRSKETRSSGVKPIKEESTIPTRRSLSTAIAGTKRPTRGSIASSSDSKATSPAVSTNSSRSSTPVPPPKRRRI